MDQNQDSVSEMEIIREKIAEKITHSPLLKEENILVDFEGEEIILDGDVVNPEAKWLAQDVATGILGQYHLDNRIRILI